MPDDALGRVEIFTIDTLTTDETVGALFSDLVPAPPVAGGASPLLDGPMAPIALVLLLVAMLCIGLVFTR